VYSIERAAASCSDAELVQNPEDLETLGRLHVPRDRLHLLGNGIDLARFRPDHMSAESRTRIRAQLGATPETIVVGAVGRLVWEKGYRDLFAAADELRQREPRVMVVVAGPTEPAKRDGIGPADMAAAEAAGVRFLGHRPDLENFYGACDLYVLASYREGFPRSAMEAAAMGLPIVATDIRGCRQVVDDGVTGLLVPPRNAAALTEAIIHLAVNDLLRHDMGRRASQKAQEEFDQKHVIDTTLAVYAKLLAEYASTQK
jgi:glycosyltransferase involved in cell wall biosynthesis